MFNPRRRRSFVQRVDQPNRLKTSWFQPSNDTMKEQEEILANTYFLVRQGDEFGERLRCVECHGRHDYITLRCINKPITGLAGGLYAYYRAIKDLNMENEMNPAQRARFEEVQQVLMNMPDLARIHPQLARKLVRDIGPNDAQIGAVSLGILEPISPFEAKRLEERINERGIRPPFKLQPLNQAEIDRALEYRGLGYAEHRRRW